MTHTNSSHHLKTLFLIKFFAFFTIFLVSIAFPHVSFAGYNEGAAAVASGNYQIAFTEFEKSAKIGDVESQDCLAYMYYMGLGARQDMSKAYRWWSKAAQSGDLEARKNRDIVFKEMSIGARASL